MTEAARKTGEALLETELGKDLKKQAEQLGKDFVSSLAGKVITGTAAAGVIGYIVAKNEKLPIGIPEIPLDKVTPGLKAKITWEGPVRSPTNAMLTFTWSPGAPSAKKKDAPTERDRFRAETARIAKEQAAFREGMKPADEKAAEDEAYWKAYWGGMNKYGLRPLSIPGLDAPKKDEDVPPVRRAPRSSAPPTTAPPAVHDTIARPGSALPADVRSDLEGRLGHDFRNVRIHTDAHAADSAAAVDARAFTVGSAVVFGAGQWSPHTSEGRSLLAHELAHVTHYERGRDPGGATLEVGRTDDPLEAEAAAAAARVAR